MASRIPGFRGEFLWELEIAVRQMLALAEAIPAEKYSWRPQPKARSVSEVLVHVASGNFMLLDAIGIAAPADLYAQVPAGGEQRFAALIRHNDKLMDNLREKLAVQALLARSLQVLTQSLTRASDAELERRFQFFGEETTVRRAYLRLLVHTHEHMGQMIAYLRTMGLAPPWPDWRPDRRATAPSR